VGRYDNAGKIKYIESDPVYGGLSREVVEAGIESGDYILMERQVAAREGKNVAYSMQRQYMPKAMAEKKEARGWKPVSVRVVVPAESQAKKASLKKPSASE